MSQCQCPNPPVNLHENCECQTMPRDIVDLPTPLYQACGGRLYRLLILTKASAVLMGDGSSVETRVNTMERNLAANTTLRFADTIAHRDSLNAWAPGDSCYVRDAKADPEVGRGAALYIWLPELRWAKVWSLLETLNIIKKDGGLAVDEETGRIYIDFASLKSSALKDILDGIVKGNGGLAVDPATGKLAIDISTLPTSELVDLANRLLLAGGGLAVDSQGRIGLDAGSFDEAKRQAFLAAIVTTGNGLLVSGGKIGFDLDAAPLAKKQNLLTAAGAILAGPGLVWKDNKLKVDFSSNSDEVRDLIRAMQSQLHIPQFLESDKNFYVNLNSTKAVPAKDTDRINAKWGETADQPFRSIQDCVDYVANNFNVGNHTLTILVTAGVYPESLRLPDFSRNSGSIFIKGRDGLAFTLAPTASGASLVKGISVIGGSWKVDLCKVNMSQDFASNTPRGTLYCVSVSGGQLTLYQHNITFTLNGAAPGNNGFYAYSVSGNGTLYFDIQPERGSYTASSFNLVKAGGNSSAGYCFGAGEGAKMHFRGDSNLDLDADSNRCRLNITGAFAAVAQANGGRISVQTMRQSYVRVKAMGAVTGPRYMALNGGAIEHGKNYFPGDEDSGSADAATFSWVTA